MKKYIFLTGGLGNQLFQFVALLSTRPSQICLISDVGNPRLSKSGIPDLMEILNTNGFEVKVTSSKLKPLSTKIFGYLLRLGITPKKYEKKFGFLKIARILGNLYFSILLRTKIRIFVSKNVGYSKIEEDCNLLIGYFQSYKYLDSPKIKEMLKNLIIFKNHKIDEMVSPKMIIVLHIRQGDYKFERSIGLLPHEYYAIGLQELIGKSSNFEIWVFSDEPDSVKSYIPKRFLEHSKFIGTELDNLESFDLMRGGNDYLLSNSTFGWWAAQLSRDENARVVAPDPWFKELEEPCFLVPSSWTRIEVPGWRKYAPHS